MGITVENGGILTTVQDEGRFGNQAFGVSTSGAMDPRAFHIANLLVGNKKTEGALEMTFIGPTLTFTSDNIIAVTGGDLTPMLDGRPFPMYKAVLVKKGQKLMFAGARNGSRGYIAFAGGLDIPLVMGSKSTLLRNHIGGVEGRKLEKVTPSSLQHRRQSFRIWNFVRFRRKFILLMRWFSVWFWDPRRMSLQKRASASFSGTAVLLPMSLTVWDAVLRENR